MRHKYTTAYFTGRNSDGKRLGYGVEGFDSFLEGKIREIDHHILSQINFVNKDVLEFGFGRGEASKYAIDHGAKSYLGVDFSPAAQNIALNFAKKFKLKNVIFCCDDALNFLKSYIKKTEFRHFDIVLMFDFVEHVPRRELFELFKLLHKVLSPTAIVAINTPNFRFDNDVIKDGLDLRNLLNTQDTSDVNEETKGMHCNKYTVVSLREFLDKAGYQNITECHFFIEKNNLKKTEYPIYYPYRKLWKEAVARKCPIKKKYVDDVVEHAYNIEDKPRWQKFSNGHLKGISLYLTDSYKKIAFPNGEHDKAMFDDFSNLAMDNNLTVFDVGGFMGVSSLLFAKLMRKGHIYTFEPNPYNLNRIQLNLSRNQKYSETIRIYHLALGDTTGSDEMLLSNQVDNGFSSTSRLFNTHVEHSHEHLHELGFTKMPVAIDTLDNFVKNTSIVPDVIKLDIEGAEHLFLLGAINTFRKYHPLLYVELHSQYCAVVCTEILLSLGYKYHVLFEEPDNRLLVKFVKKNSVFHKTITDKITFENKILLLNKEVRKYQNALSQLKNKLTKKIEFLENEKFTLENKLITISALNQKNEQYLKKLIDNPIIRTELNLVRFLKKIMNNLKGN